MTGSKSGSTVLFQVHLLVQAGVTSQFLRGEIGFRSISKKILVRDGVFFGWLVVPTGLGPDVHCSISFWLVVRKTIGRGEMSRQH